MTPAKRALAVEPRPVVRSRPKKTGDVPACIRSNAQRGAFLKGMSARKAGRTMERSNPYTVTSRYAYERGLYRRWRQGFDYADRQLGGRGTLAVADRVEA